MKRKRRHHHHHHVNTPLGNTIVIPSGMPGVSITNQPDKIVINNGVIWDRSIAPTNFGPYDAQVLDSTGAPVTTIHIPQHDQFARYVYDPFPNQVLRDNAAIVAKGLMFPYGSPGKTDPDLPTNHYSGPMSSAGITTNMGGTGERNDIGLLPEWDAHAMRKNDFTYCFAAGPGFDSMPMHRIDEKTRRLLDMTQYPLACSYWNQSGRPDFIRTAPDAGADMTQYPKGTIKGQWAMDIGHSPSIFLSYCSSQKLRFLENLQSFANFGYQTTNWYTSEIGTPLPYLNIAQTRSLGWHARLALMAYRATLDAEQIYGTPLPEPLLPSTYWKTLVDANSQYLVDGFMKDSAIQTFRYHPDKACYRPWQFDYLLEAYALGALYMPGSNWEKLFLWSLQNAVDRLDPNSGYYVAWQEPYFLRVGPVGVMPDGTNNFPFDLQPSQFCKNWDEVMANAQAESKLAAPANWQNMTQAQMAALASDPTGGGLVINWDGYPKLQLRNVMAAADYLDRNGIVNVSAALPKFPAARDLINTMVANWVNQDPVNNRIAARVSIMAA